VGNRDDVEKLWVGRDGPNWGRCCPEKDSCDNLLPCRGVSTFFGRMDKGFP
jgi:hypothetical protein